MFREIPKDRWAAELAAFTERHAQRPTYIEIDSLEFGAQEQERDFPLRGIVYDHRDGRISIMLGELEGADPHLTHSISGASSVAIGPGSENQIEMVRIAHGGGQTLIWVRAS